MRSVASLLLLCATVNPLARGVESDASRSDAERCAAYYAAQYEVPVELVHAVIEVESGWNPGALSPKGAAGLMQLTPATAVRFGVRNRFDVEDNIRGGVAYLGWLMALFDGDLRLVAAAYVAGERRVLARGLGYSLVEVYTYVSRVARLYRENRKAALSRAVGENATPDR